MKATADLFSNDTVCLSAVTYTVGKVGTDESVQNLRRDLIFSSTFSTGAFQHLNPQEKKNIVSTAGLFVLMISTGRSHSVRNSENEDCKDSIRDIHSWEVCWEVVEGLRGASTKINQVFIPQRFHPAETPQMVSRHYRRVRRPDHQINVVIPDSRTSYAQPRERIRAASEGGVLEVNTPRLTRSRTSIQADRELCNGGPPQSDTDPEAGRTRSHLGCHTNTQVS